MTYPGHPFACGITLEKISGYTVDELGKEAFISSNPMDVLRKAFQLRRVALYFDCMAAQWSPDKNWVVLLPDEWDAWFLPGINALKKAEGRQFVLQPVDGRAMYIRRGRNAMKEDGEAALELDFQLDAVVIGITQDQYTSYQLLLAQISTYTSRLPYSGYRPHKRPAAGKRARAWWRYAGLAVIQQLRTRTLTLKQAVKFLRIQQSYIPKYIQHLRSSNAATSAILTDELQAMDVELPECTILIFRRLAFAEYQRERTAEIRAQAAANQENAGGGGWVSWLLGASPNKTGRPTESGRGSNGGTKREDLTPEEYNKLLEMVSEQEDSLKLGLETPYTLLSKYSVKIGSASAVLTASTGKIVLRGGLDGVTTTVLSYPTTSKVDVAITAMGLDSFKGTFLRSGAEEIAVQEGRKESRTLAAMAENIITDRALSLSFISKPQDNSADAVLNMSLQPSYVCYDADVVEQTAAFFKPPPEVQFLDYSGISAAASTQLERARKAAAEYAVEALSGRPRLKMRLDLNAPKVTLPARNDAGLVTLALDFGRFIIETDHEYAQQLNPEEAGLYHCFALRGSNVSALLVDGEFNWQQLAATDTSNSGPIVKHNRKLLSLLDQCSMHVGLQVARYAHPSLPFLRLQPQLPSLHFHISPGRVGRLVTVMQSAIPNFGDSGEQEGDVSASQMAARISEQPPGAGGNNAWRQHVDCEGQVKVLTRKGVGKVQAVWSKQYGAIYHGSLYLYCDDTCDSLMSSHSLSTSKRVVKLPQKYIGGYTHVIALCKDATSSQVQASTLKMDQIVSDESSVILKLEDSHQADIWYRGLLAGQKEMQQVQSGRVSGITSTGDTPQTFALTSPEALSDVQKHPEKQSEMEQVTGGSSLIEIEAQLGDVALFCAGRAPTSWLEKSSTSDTSFKHQESRDDTDLGELPLIIVRASGGNGKISRDSQQLLVHMALASFEIEDLLVGASDNKKKRLATSTDISGTVEVGSDVFYDAPDEACPISPSSASGTESSPSGRMRLSSQDQSMKLQQVDKNLAEFTLTMIQPAAAAASGNSGALTTLDVKLETLHFFCNRPTVAALMTLGSDISNAASTASEEDNEPESPCSAKQQPSSPKADDEEIAEGIRFSSVSDQSAFNLNVSLATLHAALVYEGQTDTILSQASVVNFGIGVDIKMDGTMTINSTLGNIQLLDATLPTTHPYYQALGLRQGGTSSVMSVTYTSYPSTKTDLRVPQGLAYSTLDVQVNELQVVFLYRFLQENLEYIYTLLAMRLPAIQAENVGEQQAIEASSFDEGNIPDNTVGKVPLLSQPQQQPYVLFMDVQLSAPIIIMPRSTHSLDALENDLGQFHLSSKVIQEPFSEKSDSLGLLELAEMTFSGLASRVVQTGEKGANMIENSEHGWQIKWRRPLDVQKRGYAPKFDLDVSIPFLKATVSDTEYQQITSIASDNVSEEPGLPEGALSIAKEQQDHPLQPTEFRTTKVSAFESFISSPKTPSGSIGMKDTITVTPDKKKLSTSAAEQQRQDALTSVRVTVSVNQVEMELVRTLTDEQQSLARFTIKNTYVSFRNTEQGAKFVGVCIPRVEVEDMRSDLPPELSLMISSGHRASFLMLDWDSDEKYNQTLSMALQKPVVVAEPSFLLALCQFFVPSFTFGNDRPIAYTSHDILLTDEPYVATCDVWLCPAVRLLADCPLGNSSTNQFVYDGNGHKLILPDRDNLDALLPLIIVGARWSLVLKNVLIVNVESLPVCLQLGPGAKLVARKKNGVTTSDGHCLSDDETSGDLIGSPTSELHTKSLIKSAAVMPASPVAENQEESARGNFIMDISVVGLGLQLMQVDSTASSNTHAEKPPSRKNSSNILSSSSTVREAILAVDGSAKKQKARKDISIQLLAVNSDFKGHFEQTGQRKVGSIGFQGLRIEARNIVTDNSPQQDAAKDMKLSKAVRGKKGNVLLEPCKMTMKFDILSSEQTGSPIRTDLQLATSDIRITLDFGMIDLTHNLAMSSIASFFQPGSDDAVRSVSQFERLFTLDGYSNSGRTGGRTTEYPVQVADIPQVTVWRPKTAAGYAVAGYVLTASDTPPAFEVLSLAINSGLVHFPVDYELIWSNDEAAVWCPLPSPGYVALGHIVTISADIKPEKEAMVCIHGGVIVEAAVGEHHPLYTTSATTGAPSDDDHIDFWCIDNSLGTFMTTRTPTLGEDKTIAGYDLRNPLGVVPAALQSSSVAKDMQNNNPQNLSKQQFIEYCAARQDHKHESSPRTIFPTVVDFKRIWTDHGLLSGGKGVSAWRPVAPPGYVTLGDCVSKGLSPPSSAVVVLDSVANSDQSTSLLVKSPKSYQLVWVSHDGSKDDSTMLKIWQPIPPPGYVCMGVVVSYGTGPPTRGVKCLKASAVLPGARASRYPVWQLEKTNQYELPPLIAWAVDENLGTFAVEVAGGTCYPDQLWKLKPALMQEQGDASGGGKSEEESSRREQDQQGVNVLLKTGNTSLLLRDKAKVPLLEVDMGTLECGIRGPSRKVVQAYFGFELSIWAFSSMPTFSNTNAASGWEPVMEPWNVITLCDANLGPSTHSGIEPGVHFSVKSSMEVIHTTLAYSHMNALLAAYADWQMHRQQALVGQVQKQTFDGTYTRHVAVENKLGQGATMEVLRGDHIDLVHLPSKSTVHIDVPLPQHPTRRLGSSHTTSIAAATVAKDALPHDLLLVDVDSVSFDAQGGAVPDQVECCIQLQGDSADGKDESYTPVHMPRTRVVQVVQSTAENGDSSQPLVAEWKERLVLPLPSRPSTEHRLAISIVDSAAKGGQGVVLYTGDANLSISQLSLLQQPQTLKLSLASVASKDIDSSQKGDDKSAGKVVFKGTLALQKQWQSTPQPTLADDPQRATSNQRALSIASQEGIYVPIPLKTAALSTGDSINAAIGKRGGLASLRPASGCVTPFSIGKQSMVLQELLVHGVQHEVLRSLCQLVNSTDVALELSLVTVVLPPSQITDTGVRSHALSGTAPSNTTPLEVKDRISLGAVEPGKTFALPLGWDDKGKQLQFRPVVSDAGTSIKHDDGSSTESTAASHNWCIVGGHHSVVQLDNLQHGPRYSVACCQPIEQDYHGHVHSLHNRVAWFALTLDSTTVCSNGDDEFIDWAIVVSAPLTVNNSLPVSASLIIWQETTISGSKQLLERHTATIPSGGAALIYSADIQQRVSFTLYPEGYDWSEPGPVLLTDGAPELGGVELPERFRIARPGSRTPVEVFIKRDEPLISKRCDDDLLFDNSMPLVVSFVAPLWIINSTRMILEAAVVPITPVNPSTKKKEAKKTDKFGSSGLSQLSDETLMQVMDVPRVAQVLDEPALAGRRPIPAESLELLSYPLPTFVKLNSSASIRRTESTRSDRAGKAAFDESQPQHYGIRLRLGDSSWSQPLALDVLSTTGNGDSGLGDGNRSVLIRAEASGVLYEVIARLDVTPYNDAQMLKLESYLAISNRTALPLQLLQCQPSMLQYHSNKQPDSPLAASQQQLQLSQGVSMVKPNLHSLSKKMRAPPLPPPTKRPTTASPPSAGNEVVYSSDEEDWELIEGFKGSGVMHLSSTGMQQTARNAVIELPIGATMVPLNLPVGLDTHTLCFRFLNAKSIGESDSNQLPLWSRPVRLHLPQDDIVHVLIPVIGDTITGYSSPSTSASSSTNVGMAVLRMSVHQRRSSGMHIVLESLNADAPYLIENRTPEKLKYRQARVPNAPFHTLEPYSAAPYTWEYSISSQQRQELEIQENEGIAPSELYALDADGDSSTTLSARYSPLPVSSPNKQCTVRVAYYETVASSITGTLVIQGDTGSGGVLGRGGLDRVLQVAPGRDAVLLAGLKESSRAMVSTHVSIVVPGVEVSILDELPQEVLLLTVIGMNARLTWAESPLGPASSAVVEVERLQIDNQMPRTDLPVVVTSLSSTTNLPLVRVDAVMQSAGARGRAFYPFISGRVPDNIQVAVDEALVWKLLDIYQRLLATASDDSNVNETHHASSVAADMPIRIRLLSVSSLAVKLSFTSDPLSRPRNMASGFLTSLLDLASFQGANVRIRGFEMSNVNILRSALQAQILKFYQGQLLNIGLALIQSFGFYGGASKVLRILGAGVAKLAGDRPETSKASKEQAQQVTDVGEGLLEGMGTFGSSIMKGFKGLIDKPVQGARRAGVEGAMKGVASGLVGAVANPLSGALNAMGTTAQGFQASFGKTKLGDVASRRRRLPRVVSGRLMPIIRDGSERQTVIECLGQALLHSTVLASESTGKAVSTSTSVLPRYEEHVVLPADQVLMFCNLGVMLIYAPGFTELDGAAEIGVSDISEPPVGTLVWSVHWTDLLALELRYSQAVQRTPDLLVIHRKSTQQEYIVRCFQNTPQASQAKLVADTLFRKHYLDRRQAQYGLTDRRDRPQLLTSTTSSSSKTLEQMPQTMPCLDFVLKWHTNPARNPVISFWSPIPPPGYIPGGDVAVIGMESPVQPVPCLRDDTALLKSRQKAGGGVAQPATTSPVDYNLIWRFNSQTRPVSMWWPVPPPGYMALGALVQGASEIPPLDACLCIREDLAQPSQVFSSPIWTFDPVAPLQGGGLGGVASSAATSENWKVSIWPLDSRLNTFIAVRGLQKPPTELAKRVSFVEEASKRHEHM